MKSFRTQSACRIAGIDRNRFNEAVAAGNYKCAPPVARGSTRVFSEIDLIALTYYGSLIRTDEYTAGLAGKLTCIFQEQLRRTPDENEIVLVRSIAGTWTACAGSAVSDTANFSSGLPILEARRIKVENLRSIVRREADEEDNIAGIDDGSE